MKAITFILGWLFCAYSTLVLIHIDQPRRQIHAYDILVATVLGPAGTAVVGIFSAKEHLSDCIVNCGDKHEKN